MTTITTPSSLAPSLETAWPDVNSSFERFCLTAGIGAIAGAPHNRGGGRVGHRWGRTKRKIGFHGGTVVVYRGCAVTTAMKLRCRPGRRYRPTVYLEPISKLPTAVDPI